MGIPFFARWLARKYSQVALRFRRHETQAYFQKYRVASLSLDLNGIIHTEAMKVHLYGNGATDNVRALARYKASSASELEQRHFHGVSQAIQDLVDLTQPTSTLIVAVDGSSALTKQYQQKQRRYKARSQITQEQDQYFHYTSESKAPTTWDSNQITPGTPFMARLDAYLRKWLEQHQTQLPPRIIYSSHKVAGEGEHKIAHYLRTLQFQPVDKERSHVVYGLDADLIMLGLLSPQTNYKLLRDDYSEVGEVFHIFDITVARERIRTDIGSVEDFVLLSFTAGNDFLVAFPSVSIDNDGITKMMELYREVGKRLVIPATNRIDWTNLRTFMRRFQEAEPRLLEAQAQRGSKYPSIPLNDSVRNGQIDLSKFRTVYYERALGAKGAVPQLNPEIPLNGVETRLDMAKEWLGGIAWIYKYYTEGARQVNVDWLYLYNYTPLAEEIVTALTELPADDSVPTFEWSAVDRRGRNLTPFEQLVAVLPPASANLLPPALRPLLTSSSSPLADLYPSQFLADINGKMKEHEAVALLPFIDAERIRSEVAQHPLTADEQKLNTMVTDVILKRYTIPRY